MPDHNITSQARSIFHLGKSRESAVENLLPPIPVDYPIHADWIVRTTHSSRQEFAMGALVCKQPNLT
jgi:hypothetical protein